MTYKFRVGLRPVWQLGQPGAAAVPLDDVLALLGAIDTCGNIAAACKVCGMSYRHAWGTLRRFEERFGTALLITRRRQGTMLSDFAQRLLWANRRIDARLTPTLESMASELQEELERLLPQSQPHLRLHASHGFAVEGLMARLEGADPPVELRYRTATEALAALERGECDVAGFQIPRGEFEGAMLRYYREWLDPDAHLLIHLATRSTGLFVKQGNPKQIAGMPDLARTDVRFVNRQIGSSTRLLTALMLEKAGVAPGTVAGYETAEFTHMAIAAHIASGMADAGIGVETAAHRFGLGFVPLVNERYFFAVPRAILDTPRVQLLLETMRSEAFRGYVRELVGYDARDTGRIQTLAEAFG